MLPAANPVGVAVKPSQPATAQTALRTTQPQAPETARASAGEAAAANVRTETPVAVQPPEQTSVAPRLRDQETAERSERADPVKDAPTGPPPTFEESPLERQARVAFDPPEMDAESRKFEPTTENAPDDDASIALEQAEVPADPPPTPTERAEVSFAETQALAEPKEPVKVDVAR